MSELLKRLGRNKKISAIMNEAAEYHMRARRSTDWSNESPKDLREQAVFYRSAVEYRGRRDSFLWALEVLTGEDHMELWRVAVQLSLEIEENM